METQETYNKFLEIAKKYKHFCPLVYNHVHIGTTNAKSYCCVAKGNEITRNKKLTDYWNSEIVNKDRADMLSNSPKGKLKECTICWDEEEIGAKSYRHLAIERYDLNENDSTKDEVLKLIENVEAVEQGNEVPHMPTSYDIKFGNLCNLKCPSCNPDNSSQIYKEIKENKKIFNEIDNEHYYLTTENDFKWIENKEWWKVFEEATATPTKLYRFKSTGGEPLLNKSLITYLKKLITDGKAKDIKLNLVTNGIKISKDLLVNVLNKFKRCSLTISIDGTNKEYEYLRFPGKWKVLDGNVKQGYKLDIKNVKFMIHPTLSAMNILSILQVYEYALGVGTLKDPNVGNREFSKISSFAMAWDPEHICITNLLNDNMKTKVIDYYNNYIDRFEKSYPFAKKRVKEEYISQFKDIIKLVKRAKADPVYIQKFVKYIKIIDSIRNISFEKSCPKEYHLFKEYFE
tara:strand:- start:521 stop:1894 length:1374 start_codon:yes stop_codon:yes gene_type:complete